MERSDILRMIRKKINYILDINGDNPFIHTYFNIIKSLIKLNPTYIRREKFYDISKLKLYHSLYKIDDRLYWLLLAYSYMTEIEEVLLELEDYETLYNINRLNELIKIKEIDFDKNEYKKV